MGLLQEGKAQKRLHCAAESFLSKTPLGVYFRRGLVISAGMANKLWWVRDAGDQKFFPFFTLSGKDCKWRGEGSRTTVLEGKGTM